MDKVALTDDTLQTQLAAAQAELAAMRTAYQRLQRTIDRVADGVTVQDATGALIYVNDAAAQMCGFPDAETFLQAPSSAVWSRFELIDEAGQRLPVEHLPGRRVLTGDLNPPPVTVCFRSDATGEQRWSSIRATPLFDESGRVQGVVNSWHDVTALKQREVDLAAQREYFAVTLASIGDAVIVTDLHGDITFLNPSAETVTGWSAAEAIGQPLDRVFEIISEETGETVENPVTKVLRVGGIVGLSNHTLLITKDGMKIPIHDSAAPIKDAQGQLQGVVLVFRDMIDQHEAERRITQQAEILEIINRTGQLLAAELDLQTLVQAATDAMTTLVGAQFGSFFYNVINERDEAYTLYTISGVPREAFSSFPMPRKTRVFGPTFAGTGIVRSDDITKDPRYGQNAPYNGMPAGHLPVRSYLAVPVISRSGEVIGGLFFGHSEPGVFTERAEQLVVGLVAQTAIAVDNARLFTARLRSEELLRTERERFEVTLASIGDAVIATDTAGAITFLNSVAESLTGWKREEALGLPMDQVLRLVTAREQSSPGPSMRPLLHSDAIRPVDHCILIDKNGREIPVDTNEAPIRDQQDRLLGTVVVFRDITERKHQELHQRFLMEASTTLASSLDYEQTLTTLAQLAVPQFADWCVIDLQDDDRTLKQLTFAHHDSGSIALVHTSSGHSGVETHGPYNVAHVLQTGQAELITEITDDLLRQSARDPEHLEKLRRLGLTSSIVVPLHARQRVLGAITFVSTDSGRHYSEADLLMAQDLAARAAIAVDNAHLYQTAQAELTQRAQAEQQLRLVTDTLPALIAYVDIDQRYQFVNHAYEEWFGVKGRDVLGLHVRDIVGDEAYEQLRDHIDRTLAGETQSYQTVMPYKTGGTRAIEAIYLPDRDAHGNVQGYVSLVTDITRRKQDEAALRMQAHVLDSMSEGVSVSDESGIIIYTNPAEDQTFGYERGELIGKHVSVQNSYPPDENQRIVAEVIDHLKHRGMWIGEFENVKRDGTQFITRARITTLTTEGRSYWVCVQEDITVEKARAAERAQLLAREQQARLDAEAALRLRDQFLSLAAHELKTPMTAILGNAQMLHRQVARSEHSTERQRVQAETMVAQIQRLNRLISSLLDPTRIEDGRLSLELAPFDLRQIIQQLVNETQPTLQYHQLLTELPPEPLLINGDQIRLEQVLQNLLQNAIKYSPAGGTIRIAVEQRDDVVVCQVTDQGMGIPAEDRPLIFDRFYRARNINVQQISGIGIGLYVVKEIIALHGGAISVDSVEGQGSTFTIRLPRLPEPPGAGATLDHR